MTDEGLDVLLARLRALEDESEIRRVILTYGPAADAGLSMLAASVWSEDGQYDWDAQGSPLESRAAVAAMLKADEQRDFIGAGAAHFAGPPLIQVDGDRATALTYSLIMRRDVDRGRFYLWRVSAVCWELERRENSWRVQRRTNRLLDQTGAGRHLFAETLRVMFGEELS